MAFWAVLAGAVIAFCGALGGAVVGAIASVATTWFVLRDEHKRRAEEWEREERTRFHRERVQFYAEFEGAVSQLFAHHLAVRLGNPKDSVASGRLTARMTVAHARVAYVAALPVDLAAANLVDLLAVEEGQVEPKVYEVLLGEFRFAARNELGVNPPLVPTAASR